MLDLTQHQQLALRRAVYGRTQLPCFESPYIQAISGGCIPQKWRISEPVLCLILLTMWSWWAGRQDVVSNDLKVRKFDGPLHFYVLSRMSVKINDRWDKMLAISLEVDLPLEKASIHQLATLPTTWFQHVLLHLNTFTCHNTSHQPKTQWTRKTGKIRGHAEMIHPSSWHPSIR